MDIVKDILLWPLSLAGQLGSKNGAIIVVGTLAVPYLLYGMPSLENGLQPALMWYGVAGVSNYALAMTVGGGDTAAYSA